MSGEQINTRKVVTIGVAAFLLLLLLIFGNRMIVTIDAGHAGVLFKTFQGGVDVETTYNEGFHFIAPWNRMIVYEVRQQEIAEEMNVLSSNGLEISADVSAWYRPKIDELGYLHSTIGANYLRRVLIPSLRSSARLVIGRYTPEQIYSTKRDVIEEEIFEQTISLLEDKHIHVEQILIRSIILPPTIRSAIESKLKQEQESLEYEFKLTKAQQEAERQRIEAEGKATANRIISASLTDKILQEKGIDATIRLSESQNAKVVIVGNSEDGLPLILGGNN